MADTHAEDSELEHGARLLAGFRTPPSCGSKEKPWQYRCGGSVLGARVGQN